MPSSSNGDGSHVIGDIAGMSGGPILGCRGTEFDVQAIAVQSGWVKSSRTIVGDYLADVGDQIAVIAARFESI